MARKKSARGGRGLEVGLATAGGIVTLMLESVTDMFANTSLFDSYNVGDVVGLITSASLSFAGIGVDNKYLSLLGAGGFAVAVPNLIFKTLRMAGAPLPVQTISLKTQPTAYTSQGRYGRNIMLPPMSVKPMTYPRK